MSGELARIVRGEGATPLAWAGGTTAQDYLNLGDALSAVMTALLSGRPVRRVPFRSQNPRLVAVGTVGQNIAGGEAWFWGTGCSPRSGLADKAARHSPDPGLRAHVCATRGPLSGALIAGGRVAAPVFGDPVWLLPRFYRPEVEKRWELGVILHLSELADRATECHPRAGLRRAEIPAEFAGSVRLINTVTDISTGGMRARLDDILSCRRIVSTSLHGLVFAESYGIPCLPFPARGPAGPAEAALTEDCGLDLRAVDLYMGAGRDRQHYYAQPHGEPTDWAAVIDAVDRRWTQAEIDEDALFESFPIDLDPIVPEPGATIWEHPTLNAFPYSHDVAALRASDIAAGRAAAAAEAARVAALEKRLAGWRLPAVARPPAPPPPLTLARGEDGGAAVALSWARTEADAGYVNLGDALSPVMVAAMTGLPVRHAAFDSEAERLVAVGTIAHGQRRGVAHLWGPGLDVSVNPADRGAPWRLPPDTALHVHATRGPMTAAALRREGVPAPEIFGDPVYLLDRVFPLGEVEKRWDLGVIVHLSELDPWGAPAESRAEGEPSAPVRAALARYHVPKPFRDRVRIMDTRVAPTVAAFEARLREIASCRAILSTSLHGLVIADVYGVPNAWFGFREGGLLAVEPMNPRDPLDHRVRDLYAGQGAGRVQVMLTRREAASDWDRLIGLSGEIAPRRPDARALFDAFPASRAVRWEDAVWPLPAGLVPGLAGAVEPPPAAPAAAPETDADVRPRR